MKRPNFCQVGTPIQYLKWIGNDTWSLIPAVINAVCDSKVDLLLLVAPHPIIVQNTRHADFKMSGADYWQYIPQDHPTKCKNRTQPIQLNQSLN